MQQTGKKWIIIVSVVLVAALFFLFIPYGKDAAAYRLTKKYISRYYYQKPSSVVVRGGTVGANNDCVWIRLEINGYGLMKTAALEPRALERARTPGSTARRILMSARSIACFG